MQVVARFGVWEIRSHRGESGYDVVDTTTENTFKKGVRVSVALAFARRMHKIDLIDQKQTFGDVIDDGVVWGSI